MDDGATPFFMACQEGHEKVVKLLLQDKRIDPNQAQIDGETPLFKSCHPISSTPPV